MSFQNESQIDFLLNLFLREIGGICLPLRRRFTIWTAPRSSAESSQNQKILFALLFEATAATLLEVAADPKHLGAEIGFLGILHTWGQTLHQNPHS